MIAIRKGKEMGFDDGDRDSKDAEDERADFERGSELLRLVRDFVKRHKIGGEESVMQRDAPQIEAPEFVAKLCKIVGFYDED